MRVVTVVSFLSFLWAALGQPRLQLGRTILIGRERYSNVDFFGGIPFAEPPIDHLRLSPPRPKYSLSPLRSFDASSYGLPCLQPYSDADMSEDCLKLNIFRPSGIDATSSLPVMVYLYGGGFYSGSASTYDAAPLVEQSVARGTPVMFVTMDYRLGPLGFPQGPEAVERGALNLGLHDQWVALTWVQKNIASFGGDPRKVTLIGESAGALSASYHYLNENFSTVARAAVFQSGTSSTLPNFDGYRQTPSWMLFVHNTRCARAPPNQAFPCLRSAKSSDLLASLNASMALEPFAFRPVLDGPRGIISDFPARRLSYGAGGRVPFIAGTVLDEGTLFVSRGFQIEDIATGLNANYTPSPLGPGALKDGLDHVMSHYPFDPSAGSPFNTGYETFGTRPGYKRASAITGDLWFQAPRRFLSQTTKAPSYAYIFTESLRARPSLGSYHASELPYFFRSMAKGRHINTRLSRVILDYWISFAVSLTPNDRKGTNRPHWEEYQEAKRILKLNSKTIGLIPDNYRAIPIEGIINARDIFSW